MIPGNFPPCFPSKEDYDVWKLFAIRAHEPCSPCSDCTKKYKAQMKAQGQCETKVVEIQYEHFKSHREPKAK